LQREFALPPYSRGVTARALRNADMTRETAKVLIAEGPGMSAEIRDALSRFEVTSVRTFADAQSALERHRFRLVLIDLQFEECRMFELLEHLHSLDDYQGVPIVCVQGTDRRVSSSIRQNMNHAVRALGGKAFFDLRAADEMTAQTCDYLRQILALPGNSSPL
jgi:CheY-like chemotaxis protein